MARPAGNIRMAALRLNILIVVMSGTEEQREVRIQGVFTIAGMWIAISTALLNSPPRAITVMIRP